MMMRVLGLIGLALLACGSLFMAGFWSRILGIHAQVVSARFDNEDYFIRSWTVTFAVFSVAWVWLLIKTLAYMREKHDNDD